MRVTNESGVEWEQDLLNQINLVNHWIADDRAMSVHDDGRRALPGRMRHTESHDIELRVRSPRQPGPCAEIDLVQENIAWFAQLGWPVAKHEIDVCRSR